MEGLDRKANVDTALAELTNRLVKRFGHRLERDVVDETVALGAARWRDAPIVDFVPVLTERWCVARLRVLADEAARSDVSIEKREDCAL